MAKVRQVIIKDVLCAVRAHECVICTTVLCCGCVKHKVGQTCNQKCWSIQHDSRGDDKNHIFVYQSMKYKHVQNISCSVLFVLILYILIIVMFFPRQYIVYLFGKQQLIFLFIYLQKAKSFYPADSLILSGISTSKMIVFTLLCKTMHKIDQQIIQFALNYSKKY